MDLPIEPAVYVQRSHAGNSFNAVFNLIVDDVAHLDGIQVTRNAKDQNRKAGQIKLA